MPEYEQIKHFKGTHVRSFLVTIRQRSYHWHDDIEILTSLKGCVEIHIAGRKINLCEGSFIVVDPKAIHSISDISGNNILLAVQIDPEYAVDFFEDLSGLHFQSTAFSRSLNEETDRIIPLMAKIMRTYLNKEKGFQFRQAALLNELMYLIYRNIPYSSMEDNVLRNTDKTLKRINLLLKYIHENYYRKITLNELARQAELGETYLSHHFKDTLGVSFQEYLRITRMNKAISLLIRTDRNVLEIAYECGFSDYRYLNKAFMKEYGCTPYQFRKNRQSDDRFSAEIKRGSRHDHSDEEINGQYIYEDGKVLAILDEFRI